MRLPLRTAIRSLTRTPVFSATAALTLALGIGATTALFTVVNGVLLRPLPFDEADRLVSLWHTAPGLDLPELEQSPATYLTYRSDSRVLEDVALWDARVITVTVADETEEVSAFLVTDAFLDLLRVQPALGRDLDRADDAPGAPETVLVSHGFWERELGADPAVVGSALTVGGRPREVIGILPEGFRFLDRDPAILYPARFDPAEVSMGQFSYRGLARMRPDVEIAEVATETDRLARIAVDRYPGPLTMSMFDQARFASDVRPLRDDLIGSLAPLLWTLFGAVGFVLAIACANVANLFLLRAEEREREIAVRTALGADRWTVARVFLTEAVVLGAVGGLIGMGLAWAGLEVLVSLTPALPRLSELGLDGWSLAFALVASLFASIAFGLVPVVRRKGSMGAALREGGRGGSSGPARQRLRHGLVAAQVALALLLVVGSGLMARSFGELRGVDPGFTDPDQLLTFRVSLPSGETAPPGFQSGSRAAFAVLEDILREIRDVPGVESASGVSPAPMAGSESDPLEAESHRPEPGQLPPIRRFVRIVPGYFETMGIPILRGRDITDDDLALPSRVAVLSESIAREEWGSIERAIGQRVATINIEGGEPVWYEVVGVVGDVRLDGLDQPLVPAVYWPAVQDDFYGAGAEIRTSLTFVVRAAPGATDRVLEEARGIASRLAPGAPIASVRSLGETVDESLARTSFMAVMIGISATLALLLGTIGLYGVVSYAVSRRGREFGIRMAMGAQGSAIRGMVVRGGLAVTGIGVVLGVIGALAATRILEASLYGVSAADPLTYVLAIAVLLAVATLASWIPARRAVAVDPVVTLRSD